RNLTQRSAHILHVVWSDRGRREQLDDWCAGAPGAQDFGRGKRTWNPGNAARRETTDQRRVGVRADQESGARLERGFRAGFVKDGSRAERGVAADGALDRGNHLECSRTVARHFEAADSPCQQGTCSLNGFSWLGTPQDGDNARLLQL